MRAQGYDSAAERIVAEIRNGADTVGEHVIEEFVAELSQPDSLLASALIERLVPKLCAAQPGRTHARTP